MGKIRVKSHVQQERNMSGTAKKFPGPAPEINKPKRATPYVPKLPKDGGGGAGASSSSNGANPFARQLASGDKEVRDATFAALAKWLNARKDVPMLDMKKIWKGLFYAMWHADGWDVQEELAERMGEAVHEMKHKVALCYLGVFYITARREWIGIDRHRMDKYLRLVRRMTSHALRYCANRDWAEGATSDVSQMFTRAAMAPASAPNATSERGVVDVGLRLHLAEVFVPELRKVAAGQDYVEVGCDPEKENEGNGGAPITVFRGGKKPTEKKGVPGAFGREKRPDTKSKDKKTKDAKKDLGPKKRDPKPVPPSSVALLLAPFSAVLAVDAHRALHERVVSEVFEAALEGADGGVATRMMDDPASDEDDRAECAAAIMVRLDAETLRKMSREFIDVGAEPDVGDLQRESLYALHTMFKRAARVAKAAAEEKAAGGSAVVAEGVVEKKQKNKVVAMEESEEEEEESEASEEEEDASEEEEEESEEEAAAEAEADDSFHTADGEDDDEEDDEEDDDDDDEMDEDDEEEEPESAPSTRRLGAKDDDEDATDDSDSDSEEEEEEELDEFEEADEFEDDGMDVDVGEEVEDEEEEEEEEEEDDSEEDSMDDTSDQDESSEEESEGDVSGSESDGDGGEAAIAAATAAAERKALRKAERWAAAVGSPAPASNSKHGHGGGGGASALARRAVGAVGGLFGGGSVSGSAAAMASPSPSKRVAWNLKRNTRHTPTGPPNPVKGASLRSLLSSTPKKGLLRPIHAAAAAGMAARAAPGSAPAKSARGNGGLGGGKQGKGGGNRRKSGFF